MNRLWPLLVVAFFLVLGATRALHPGMHVDEGLFVGAARRVLGGDLLLIDYWFDKPMLGPFMIALGIAVAGVNPLGFHLAGWVASMVMAVQLTAWIREILQGRSTRAGAVAMPFVCLAVVVAPLMMMHHASGLLDPYLLLFLVLFGRTLYQAAREPAEATASIERRAYRYFALAALCKLSVAMWAPMLVAYWWVRGPAASVKRFWRATWGFAAISLLFMLTNPEKLAPLIWFGHLFGGGRGDPNEIKPGLFERFGLWFQTALGAFGPTWLGALVMILAVLASIVVWRDARRDKWSLGRLFASPSARDLSLLVIPFWLHAVGLWLAGVNVFERYLYILIPQLLLVLTAGVASFPESMRRFVLPGAVSFTVVFAAFALTPSRYEDHYARALPSRASGRQLARVATEIPPGGVLHNENLLWQLHPFTPGTGTLRACDEPRCYGWAQTGRAPFTLAYRIREVDAAADAVRQLDLSSCEGKRTEHRIDAVDLLSPASLKRALRLGGWAKSVSGEPTKPPSDVTNMPQTVGCARGWLPIAGAPFAVHLTTPLGPATILTTLIVTQSARLAKTEGEGRWIAALRIESVRLDGAPSVLMGANLVDLVPIMHKGYLVPLGPLALPSNVAPGPATAIERVNLTSDFLTVGIASWR